MVSKEDAISQLLNIQKIMLENSVQHCDIKPSNIVVNIEGKLYLIDNGDWGVIGQD